ncbi:MAG: hypothetical protein WCC12_15450, partial [Anaerolineales bacterium]
CEVAAAAEAGQLVLFHHDPAYSDAMVAGMEASAQRRFSEAQAAFEGLEIALRPLSSALHQTVTPLQARERDVKYAHDD